jgi:endonuclease/exonuclease/phosphatase family metal-dependent hydrolase
MYVPPAAVALFAVAVDLLWRGRALGRARFGLSALAVVLGGWWAFDMVGRSPDIVPGSTDLTVLHWNVLWGGERRASDPAWPEMIEAIAARPADVVVLSESPGQPAIDALLGRLGPGWQAVRYANEPNAHYLFSLVVAARGRVSEVARHTIPTGRALLAEAVVDGRTVRVLVVDGESRPTLDRTPRLHVVAQTLAAEAAAGRPVDVVAGDFNAVGQAIGFEAFARQGYADAARHCRTWRGTYPRWLPLYDIDHIWISPRWRVSGGQTFATDGSDHRGTVARLRPAGAGPP